MKPQKLYNRLKKININIELFGNYPWVYIDSVNNNRIKKEDHNTDHGFDITFENNKNIFVIIRKYVNFTSS